VTRVLRGCRCRTGQGSFRGRKGTFRMSLPQGSGSVQMPLTVLDLPTMLEAYRTIDGKSGDYVKTADVSQVRERAGAGAGLRRGRGRRACARRLDLASSASSIPWRPVLSRCLPLTTCSRAHTHAGCQIMVVHDDEDEAQAMRGRRPTGRSHHAVQCRAQRGLALAPSAPCAGRCTGAQRTRNYAYARVSARGGNRS
jgi:hypothetical protein